MDVDGFSLKLEETNRMTMDAKASERTGMELYLSPFRPKDGFVALVSWLVSQSGCFFWALPLRYIGNG